MFGPNQIDKSFEWQATVIGRIQFPVDPYPMTTKLTFV
jgi:hypothetical protein